MSRFKYDETAFKPNQREAALALVEREFTPTKERKTKDQIAEDCGISRMTLHRWETGDPNFIAYKNHLASQFIDTKLRFVYSKLLDSIKSGSTKSIELYLKRIGDLNDQSELTITDKSNTMSHEERKKALLARLENES